MPDITIEIAAQSDLRKILDLQKEAYISEAQIYNDFNIPPLTESLDEIQKAFAYQLFLKIERGGAVLGSVRAFETEGVCQIGRLIVMQSHQNQGYGSRLLNEIETKFPQAEKYELFTGDKSKKNLHLYRKSGYEVIRQQKISESLTLVFLHKINKLNSTKYSD